MVTISQLAANVVEGATRSCGSGLGLSGIFCTDNGAYGCRLDKRRQSGAISRAAKRVAEWQAAVNVDSPLMLNCAVAFVLVLSLSILLIDSRKGAKAPAPRPAVNVITPAHRLNDVRLTIKGQSVSIAETAPRSDAILWRDATAEILADNCESIAGAGFLKITEDIPQKEKPLKKAIAAGKQHLMELSKSIQANRVFLAATKERITIDAEAGICNDNWYTWLRNKSKMPVVVWVRLVATTPSLPDPTILPVLLPLGLGSSVVVLPAGEHAMVNICRFRPTGKTNGICAFGIFSSYVRIPKENYELTIRAFTKNGATATGVFKMIDAGAHGGLVNVG